MHDASVWVAAHEQQRVIAGSERQSLVVGDRCRQLDRREAGRAHQLLNQLNFDRDEVVRVNERAKPHPL